MDSPRWYRVGDPAKGHYLYRGTVPLARPIFQGDVFEGVPSFFVRHPSDVGLERRNSRDDLEPLVEPVAYRPEDVREKPTVLKIAHAMVVPHICNYYETEAGKRRRVRVVALVRKLSQERIPEDWNGLFHLFPLPDLLGDGQDYVAQLDCLTTVEDAFLAKRSRVAALSYEGWLALQQRLANFFARFVAKWPDLDETALPDWSQAERDQDAAMARVAEPLSEGRGESDDTRPKQDPTPPRGPHSE